jgi:transposase InsO family protein
MSAEIRQHVEACDTCATYCDKQPQETPAMSETPSRPWQKVGSDLLTFKGQNYLITTDYCSNFFEIDRLPEITSENVILRLKQHFARHGIPDCLISDNGRKYTSETFKKFSQDWKFQHETISPGNSQSNGAAEAAVKIAKRLMRKAKRTGEDPYIGLLSHRNTPTEGMNTSPAQRLMGRRTKSTLPMANTKLKPTHYNLEAECRIKETRRAEQAKEGNKDLKSLNIGDNVRMQPLQVGEKEWKEAMVKKKLSSRSYEVETAGGQKYRRNRRHIRSKVKSTHSRPD